jgi:hypothetical protein
MKNMYKSGNRDRVGTQEMSGFHINHLLFVESVYLFQTFKIIKNEEDMNVPVIAHFLSAQSCSTQKRAVFPLVVLRLCAC